MNKEKLKELLENPELGSLLNEFLDENQTCQTYPDYFIEEKKKELEEPVYKTEDGYEVGALVKVFALCDNKIESSVYCSAINAGSPIFKLKENAENYLIENAEMLSWNDISHFFNSTYGHIDEKLIKQKIKQKLGL